MFRMPSTKTLSRTLAMHHGRVQLKPLQCDANLPFAKQATCGGAVRDEMLGADLNVDELWLVVQMP